MNLLCKLFGHKYIQKSLELNVYEYICERCGKNRDIYAPGDKKSMFIKYYKKGDGKKNAK